MNSRAPKVTNTQAFTPIIGVICALPTEYTAAQLVFQCSEPGQQLNTGRSLKYSAVTVRSRSGLAIDVVITMAYQMGTIPSALDADGMRQEFPTLRHIIMTGIAGAAPNPAKVDEHVRLGDIVITDRNGVLQYDFDKESPNTTQIRSPPRPPSKQMLEAAQRLESSSQRGIYPWEAFIKAATAIGTSEWNRPESDTDILRDDPANPAVAHPHDPHRRDGNPRVFSGTIASGNKLLKNPSKRDMLRDKYGVRAIEMEGSGVADATWARGIGYFVVRGTVDYCNESKNDAWHKYSSIVAAAYTRALIEEFDHVAAASDQSRTANDSIHASDVVHPNNQPTTGLQLSKRPRTRADSVTRIVNIAEFLLFAGAAIVIQSLVSRHIFANVVIACGIGLLVPTLGHLTSRYRSMRVLPFSAVSSAVRFLIASIMIALLSHVFRAQLRRWHRQYFGLVTCVLILFIAIASYRVGLQFVSAPSAEESFAELALTIDAAPLDIHQRRRVLDVIARVKAQPHILRLYPHLGHVVQSLELLYTELEKNGEKSYEQALYHATAVMGNLASSKAVGPGVDHDLLVLYQARLSMLRGQASGDSLGGAIQAIAVLAKYDTKAARYFDTNYQLQLTQSSDSTTPELIADQLRLSILATCCAVIAKSYDDMHDWSGMLSLGNECVTRQCIEATASRLLTLAVSSDELSPESHARAVNNRLDLDIAILRRVGRASTRAESSEYRLTASDRKVMEGGAARVREGALLLQKELAVRPTPRTFLTVYQAYLLLAHDDREQYFVATPEERVQFLALFRRDTRQALDALGGALAMGWSRSKILNSGDPSEESGLDWIERLEKRTLDLTDPMNAATMELAAQIRRMSVE